MTGQSGAPAEEPPKAVPGSAPAQPPTPTPPIRTPLYQAQHAQRYERQERIREYEQQFNCRLVVFIDAIFARSVTYFEELISEADPNQPLHMLLDSPGGDGESAIRILRSAHARCSRLTVVVPDQAKSAATLLALGTHDILMGPSSDLGPTDPQLELPGKPGLVAAKDIIAAVDEAVAKVQQAKDTYPLYAALLSDVTAIVVQQARSAIDRSGDLLKLALSSCPGRDVAAVDKLYDALYPLLIKGAKEHSAVFGTPEAAAVPGLPITRLSPLTPQWQMIWGLWTRYFVLNRRVYEGSRASQTFAWR
jgi:hypothetical protein